MRNVQRPQGQEAMPCQDTLKAFLAKRRIAGMFYHCQLAKHLARAGFEVRWIERQDNHADVWDAKVRRGKVPVGREIEWMQKQVCRFLKRYGIRYPKKEVCVLVHGDRIEAAFNWANGEPGWLSFQRAKVGRRPGNKS